MSQKKQITFCLGCAILLFSIHARTQIAFHQSVNKQFEVSTIKESETDEYGGIAIRGRQLVTKGTTVADLMAFAYGLQKRQVVDGPEWTDKQRYDLVAEAENKNSDASQIRLMLAALLADRFNLLFDHSERKMPVLSMSKAKGPLKLKKSDGDSSSGASIGFNGPGSMTVRNATMAEFARLFQRYGADRPIIDDTEIEGKYDIILLWNPDPLGSHGSAEDRPDLNTAFKEQLGLELSKKDALAPVLVIKRLERPSAKLIGCMIIPRPSAVRSLDRHYVLNGWASWLLIREFALRSHASFGRIVGLTSEPIIGISSYGPTKAPLIGGLPACVSWLIGISRRTSSIRAFSTGMFNDTIRSHCVECQRIDRCKGCLLSYWWIVASGGPKVLINRHSTHRGQVATSAIPTCTKTYKNQLCLMLCKRFRTGVPSIGSFDPDRRSRDPAGHLCQCPLLHKACP